MELDKDTVESSERYQPSAEESYIDEELLLSLTQKNSQSQWSKFHICLIFLGTYWFD